jgi:hypothetical protein
VTDREAAFRRKAAADARAYRDAHDRFVAQLREADAADVHHVPAGGGWSAAQIGWHVAAVDASFAAVLTGEVPAAKPIADGTSIRSWREIADAMPGRLEAGKRAQPPAEVRRDEVLVSLEESAAKMEAALAGLSEERGSGYAITHPVIGTVALSQIGEWAAAHVVRHHAQTARVLPPRAGRA